MPRLRPCITHGCPELVEPPASRCAECQGTRERTRDLHRAEDEPHRAIYRTAKWSQARSGALYRAGHRCQYTIGGVRCGETKDLQVHHITPLSAGGPAYDPSNLAVLCPPHHAHVEHITRAEAAELPELPTTEAINRARGRKETA